MNSNSSRSHSIVQFTISSTRLPATPHRESRAEGPPIEESVTTRAKLSLVDLAGSEKGGSRSLGEDGQERERSRINSSLSALSNCICRLGEAGRRHVPFRDSALTRQVWLVYFAVTREGLRNRLVAVREMGKVISKTVEVKLMICDFLRSQAFPKGSVLAWRQVFVCRRKRWFGTQNDKAWDVFWEV